MDGSVTIAGASARDPEFLFLPLGGAGEIGMNLNLYAYGGKWVMVDLGVSFGENAAPGIDVVMPDPGYIVDRRQDLLGIVLTHAHEDHLGAVHHLWRKLRCPIYATPFTASVLRRKLAEAGLTKEAPITVIPMQGTFELGPFSFQLITMTHSIPEPNAVVIRTPLGTVMHTGDWKFDHDPLVGEVSDEAALRAVGDEGVLALVGDSTNVFREGEAGSESDVRTNLIELIGQYKTGRIAVACFASNVARLESIAIAAAANGRQVALVGRSLHKMVESARETGYLKDMPSLISDQEAAKLPADQVLLICTGSQGEPRAALARIAAETHPTTVLDRGDVVIFSSRIIPGNEKEIGRLQDQLIRLGVEVVTEHDAFIHVSGHPARDELARMYALVRPKLALPVHGELRHMTEHAALAEACQVPQSIVVENGALVRLAPGVPAIIDHVQAGRLGVDGTKVVRLDDPGLKERSRAAEQGVVVTTLVIDRHGRLKTDPILSLIGLAEGDSEEDDEAIALIEDAVTDAVADLDRDQAADDAILHEAVRRAIRRAVNAGFGHKPIVEIHVVRV